jgi:flagellar basal-body rod protein FlgB
MADKSGFDPIIGALNTSMNLRLMNQNVISTNIANADTPGFKAKAMEFESVLRDVLNPNPNVAEAKRLTGTEPVEPEIYDDPNGVESLDGNTVDRSEQMAKMAENQLLYEASVEMLKKKLGMLKYSISEGGGNH